MNDMNDEDPLFLHHLLNCFFRRHPNAHNASTGLGKRSVFDFIQRLSLFVRCESLSNYKYVSVTLWGVLSYCV